MSYTLRGRIDSRLATLFPVVAAACVLALAEHRWWPVEAAGLMLGLLIGANGKPLRAAGRGRRRLRRSSTGSILLVYPWGIDAC